MEIEMKQVEAIFASHRRLVDAATEESAARRWVTEK